MQARADTLPQPHALAHTTAVGDSIDRSQRDLANPDPELCADADAHCRARPDALESPQVVEQRQQVAKDLLRTTEAQFFLRPGASEDAPEDDANLGGGLRVPPRIPHRRGTVALRPAPLQRDGEDIRGRLRGCDVILVDDQEILGPCASPQGEPRFRAYSAGGRGGSCELLSASTLLARRRRVPRMPQLRG